MASVTATGPTSIDHYEGLIRTTASMYAGVEEDYDDICQILRIKVWQAITNFKSERFTAAPRADGKSPIERYVFSCMKNQCKDLVKKKRRDWLYFDGLFDNPRERNGAEDQDAVNAGLRNHVTPYLSVVDNHEVVEETSRDPRLSDVEHEVSRMLVAGYNQLEIQEALGLTGWRMAGIVRDTRAKLRPEAAAAA